MIMRPIHRIMYIGSCMITWRDKAALSRHKLNRFSPSLFFFFAVPLSSYIVPPPTLSHSDHREKRPPRRGTHLLHIARHTKESFPLLLSSYVHGRARVPLKQHLSQVGTNVPPPSPRRDSRPVINSSSITPRTFVRFPAHQWSSLREISTWFR
jgi:hypothetical protein